MFTQLLLTVRLSPELPSEYRTITVNNREVLAKLNRAEMLLYLAGSLKMLPEQIITWKKAPDEMYHADKLLELMLADGFERHETDKGVMLLKSLEKGVWSFKWDDLAQYHSRHQPEIAGWFIGEHLFCCPLIARLDMSSAFQPKLMIEYDI
ncbi:hypothetical protein [Wielerella bovis]|uniref:hypothetical protein n=1 Tax=Wielerella bovis TaxID=2917790 RepID=UPI0020186505|nr:hypothetical protein [Wielerella bovis]MCG7657503.1 hypothetical protein [Wielerella bovis]MCG7659724.1 hypothetical protein [Wielerella bovis]